jgi:glycosyltransferase involved in cell wall biosynthesis
VTILFVSPVLNEEVLLPVMIKSLLKQTSSNWQLLICNNASSDWTSQVAMGWAKNDTRIQCVNFSERKNSVFESWIRSIEYAFTNYDCEYIQIIPGDDHLLSQDYVEKAINNLTSNGIYGLVPKFQYDSQEVSLNSITQRSLFKEWKYVHLVFGLYKKEHLQNSVNKLLLLNKTGNDFDWWLSFFLISDHVVFSSEIIFYRSTRIAILENINSDIQMSKSRRFKPLRKALSPLRRYFNETLKNYRHYIVHDGSIDFTNRVRLLVGFIAKILKIV